MRRCPARRASQVQALSAALPRRGARVVRVLLRALPLARLASTRVALPSIAALALLFWQTRAAPAAQMMALPSATALFVLVAWPWLLAPERWKRYVGVLLAIIAFGAAVPVGMKAFRGDEAQAHRIVAEYRSDYLMICPDMSTATIFMSEAPGGFYGQLVRGKVPGWLQPVELPEDSPFRMWKVVG